MFFSKLQWAWKLDKFNDVVFDVPGFPESEFKSNLRKDGLLTDDLTELVFGSLNH